MAFFELTAPDGGVYHVDAPDEHQAVAALGQMLGGTKAPEAAPVAATEQPSALTRIRDAIHAPTRALQNGFLLGLGDRARAVIDSALSGGGYGQHLADEQAQSDQFTKDHPIASPVLNAAGGAAAPLGALGAAAKATTLGGKMVAGAGAGGAIGTVQGALSSRDYTDLPQVAKDAAIAGGTSALIGGAMPAGSALAGKAIGAVTNYARGNVVGMSRAASGHLVDALMADGPAAVKARAAELGPEANMADLGPALLGKAQGASLNSDEGRSVLQTALTTRDKATNARIQSDVSGALGPAEDPQTVTDAIKAHRSAIDAVNYPAALDNAPPVKIAPVMVHLLRQDRSDAAGINGAKGPGKRPKNAYQDRNAAVDGCAGHSTVRPARQ